MAPLTRCMLASAPHRDTFGYSMPPPGLLRLGGELLRRGRPVALEDLAFRVASGALALDAELGARAAELLLERAADLPGGRLLIGLSTMGATLPAALLIAAALRERDPDALIALGGPGCGGLDGELLLRFPAVDVVVRGEGEVTLPLLLERLDEAGGEAPDLTGLEGVTWWDADGELRREADRPPIADLDELPPPAWELLPELARYKELTGEREGLTPIDSGRGCVYDCSFCSIGRYWGRRSRPLPAARLAAEVLALRELPAAKSAYLCHDLFGADRDHALEFCRLMEDAGSPVPWECRARIDHLDGELLDAMGRAGCYRVLYGIESGDGGLRNAHDKHMELELDVPYAVERAARAGVTPILSCILGLPGETDVELARTLDVAADAALAAGVNLSFHLPNPQPGCRLGDERGETRPVEGIRPDMAWGAGESAPERALIEAHPGLFSTWHLLTDQYGGEQRLHELAQINRELSQTLMRFPRTWAALRRSHGADSLALFRAWHAAELSFEGFTLSAQDPLARELLAWEQALLRAAARASVPARSLAGTPRSVAVNKAGYAAPPRAIGELLQATHDLPAAVSALRSGAPLGPGDQPTTLAIVPGPRGTRSLRVTPDVKRVLALLDGRPLDQLEHDHPGVTTALEQLATQGIVHLPHPDTTPVTTPTTPRDTRAQTDLYGV